MTKKRARRGGTDGAADDPLSAALLAGFDRLQYGVAIFDADLKLLVSNERFHALRHFPPELCVPGVAIADLFRYNAERGDYGSCNVDQEVEARIAEIKRRKPRSVEQEMPDGRILLIRSDPITTGGVVVTLSDVTEARRAERALRESEERHVLVAEAATEGLYDWNIVHNSLYVSPRLESMFGSDKGELTPDDWNERVHPDDMHVYRRALVDLFKRRVDHLHCEYRVRSKTGDYLWLHDSGTALRNEEGRAVRLVGAVADVTERKRMEAALRESEERYALAANAVGYGIYSWDVAKGQIEYSPGLYRALRLDPKDLKGPEYWDARMHSDDREPFKQRLVDHFKGVTPRFECDIRYQSSSGEWRWARQHGLAQRDENGQVYQMIGSVGDITDQKRLEAELETARQQLLEAVESISEGFLLTDSEDRIVLCNSKLLEFYSGAVDLLTPGRPFEDMLRTEAERDIFVTDGKAIGPWVEARLERRRNPRGPFEYRLKDGRWLRISERRTREGGVVGIYTDITGTKRREQELSAARDQAMEATQAKSWFLANMSHELRTPLNAVIGITELLEDEARDDGLDDYIEPLQRVSRAGKHLLHLINEVLDLSKIEAGRLEFHVEEIDLASLAQELNSMAQPLAEANGNRLQVDCPSNIGLMRADLTRVRQVLLNLLSNACKFTEGGRVALSLRREGPPGNEWIVAVVSDSGIGMTDEQMSKIFQEFSQADASTTRKYGGTGLGLTISQQLCGLMGGKITVESELGKGSTFTMRVPAEVDGDAFAQAAQAMGAGDD